jgi:hypothetical protein
MTIAIDLDFDSKLTGGDTGFDAQLSMYNISSPVTFHLNSTFNQLVDGSDGGGTTSSLPGAGYENNLIYQSGNKAANNFAGVAGLNLSQLAAVNADNIADSM